MTFPQRIYLNDSYNPKHAVEYIRGDVVETIRERARRAEAENARLHDKIAWLRSKFDRLTIEIVGLEVGRAKAAEQIERLQAENTLLQKEVTP